MKRHAKAGTPRWRSDLGALGVVLVTLVSLVVGGYLWAADSSPGPAAAAQPSATAEPPLATLKILRPEVEFQREGRTTFVPAKDGRVLRQGDAIRTDEGGLAQIDFTDGSLTRLGPSTEYTLELLTDERGSRQTRGNLAFGETWHRAAAISETGSFEVEAGGTTAAVEGTAFSFSCAPPPAVSCTIVDVVDNVRVTTESGTLVQLAPATSVASVNDNLGPLTRLTYEDLIALPFIVINVWLDAADGKGLGLGDLPPPSTGPVTSITDTTTPPTTTTTTTTTTVAAPDVVVSADTSEPPVTVDTLPPPPPPPPFAPECADGAWTALVGAAGETFATEVDCAVFVLDGGELATVGPGQFIIPLGQTATLSAAFHACNALQYGYQLNFGALVRAPGPFKPAGSCGLASAPGTTIEAGATAVLLRVFLDDVSCGTTFFSDGNHAQLDPANPSVVWIMDAGGAPACALAGVPRPFVPADLNLVVTVSIG